MVELPPRTPNEQRANREKTALEAQAKHTGPPPWTGDEQRTVLIGEAYKAQKLSRGAADGFRGNQHTKVVSAQNGHLPKPQKTADKIAEQFGIGKETVKRAEQFLDGLNAAEAIAPGFKDAVLTGDIKVKKGEEQARSRTEATVKPWETQEAARKRRELEEVERHPEPHKT